jgi:alpha/beta superfamily hydrolase
LDTATMTVIVLWLQTSGQRVLIIILAALAARYLLNRLLARFERSQGKFDRGEGELSDAASALDWLQSYNPNASACWIAGFSFGAWIGMQLLMRRPEIDGFICVAPPANLYDYSFLAPCPSSGLMVNGDKDRVVPTASVAELAAKTKVQKGVKIEHAVVPEANHFFQDRMEDLWTWSAPTSTAHRRNRQAKESEQGHPLAVGVIIPAPRRGQRLQDDATCSPGAAMRRRRRSRPAPAVAGAGRRGPR